MENMVENLIKYFEWCEMCMGGYPNDLYRDAKQRRKTYLDMAFGAATFVAKNFPELDARISDLIDNEWGDRLSSKVETYFTT